MVERDLGLDNYIPLRDFYALNHISIVPYQVNNCIFFLYEIVQKER